MSSKILKAPGAFGQGRTHTDANVDCGLKNPILDGWSRDTVTLLRNQIVCVVFFLGNETDLHDAFSQMMQHYSNHLLNST